MIETISSKKLSEIFNIKLFYVITLLFAFTFFSFIVNSQNWELRKDVNDIKVYTRFVEGSDYKEVKVEILAKSTLAGVSKILNEVSGFPKWVYSCSKAIVLKQVSPNEGYTYSVIEAPWPVSDRDVVTHYVQTQDPVTKIITVNLVDEKNYLPTQDNKVRVASFVACMKIIPLKNGMVQIIESFHTEPGGWVPSWLSNIVIIDGPYYTFYNFKKMLALKEYNEYRTKGILEPED
ncbi:MAG: START domain-containing protein [Bacteroidales bacterium]